MQDSQQIMLNHAASLLLSGNKEGAQTIINHLSSSDPNLTCLQVLFNQFCPKCNVTSLEKKL